MSGFWWILKVKPQNPTYPQVAENPVDFTLLYLIHKRHQFCSPKEVREYRMVEEMIAFLLIKETCIWI